MSRGLKRKYMVGRRMHPYRAAMEEAKDPPEEPDWDRPNIEGTDWYVPEKKVYYGPKRPPRKKSSGKSNSKKQNMPRARKRSYKSKRKSSRSGKVSKVKLSSSGAGRKIGERIGGWLGAKAQSFLKSVVGLGAYTVNSNTLMDQGVPMMNPTGDDCGTIRLRHREFLGTVQSSNVFRTQKYVINPALTSMFPWGSSIAAQFQEYQLMGMLVCYISTCATALASGDSISLGQVALSTQYNVYQNDPENLGDVLNQQFATTNKVSTDVCHPIECEPNQTSTPLLFTRTGEVGAGQDLRLYDHANVYVSTDGIPSHTDGTTQTIGQLWVTYDIKLTKPRVTALDGGLVFDAFYNLLAAPQFSPLQVLGTSQQKRWDTIGLQIIQNSGAATVNQIVWPVQKPGVWFVYLGWLGASTGQPFLSSGLITFTNCTVVPNLFEREAPAGTYTPTPYSETGQGVPGASGISDGFFIKCIDPNAIFSVNIGNGGAWVVPQVSVLNVYVTQANTAEQSAVAFEDPAGCRRPCEEPSDEMMEAAFTRFMARRGSVSVPAVAMSE